MIETMIHDRVMQMEDMELEEKRKRLLAIDNSQPQSEERLMQA
eukprot:CAMPEP_0117586388 /NCGR_PEP_ID=MMETSP0784-20121206/68699_1 /TAXON_ID=39447 /ORGANISM="" /LENGTH=42 /DNA_ID= /DNA_START= /DNA_END= /DNA_ORIENTATION=